MGKEKIYIYKDENNPDGYSSYLNDYYLPIIGGKAVFLYRFLKEYNNKSIIENDLINLLSFSNTDYLYSRNMLEAIGLIFTYKRHDEYKIILNPVLPPESFFNKEHLRKVLLNALNNNLKEFEKIENKYKNDLNLDDFENISKSFLDIYNIKIEDNNLKTYKIEEKRTRKDINFSFSSLYSLLKKNSQISSKMIKEEDEIKIKDLVILYNINEKEMAKYLTIYFDPLAKDEHFNFKEIEKEIISNSSLSTLSSFLDNNKERKTKSNNELIQYYDSLSPLDFIKKTIDGKEPSDFEKAIIKMLINDYHYDRVMTNAMLDYALKKDNNRLYIKNIKQYANDLIRNNVNDIYSMLESFYNKETYKEIKESKKINKISKKVEIKKEKENKNIDESILNDDIFKDDDF